MILSLALSALAFAPQQALHRVQNIKLRASGISSLLSLGDNPDFDPFAADYPAAMCEDQISAVRLVTTAGECMIVLNRAYSPEGVDRFLELVQEGFFTDMLLCKMLGWHLCPSCCHTVCSRLSTLFSPHYVRTVLCSRNCSVPDWPRAEAVEDLAGRRRGIVGVGSC